MGAHNNNYLPPGLSEGDYNLHHVCVYVRAWVTQFSLKLLHLHILGKFLCSSIFLRFGELSPTFE